MRDGFDVAGEVFGRRPRPLTSGLTVLPLRSDR